MTEALGEKYTDRLISAENVITDFRVRRIQREIIAFSNAVEIQRQIMEKALTDIKPGITTREDVGWWAADQLLAGDPFNIPIGDSVSSVHAGSIPFRITKPV